MRPTSSPRAILVTDFDGTLTRVDFYKMALARLLPADVPNFWQLHLEGKLTHFEAMNEYFKLIRTPEPEILTAIDGLQLTPRLAEHLIRLREAGWEIVVASAGCEWYIRHLFQKAGVDVVVHANQGSYDPGRGLIMELPTASPFFARELGIDKAAVVKDAQKRAATVAFAGDGFPDLSAARLVPAPWRFAKADLAQALGREHLPFRPFEEWSQVAEALLEDFRN